MDKIWLQHYPSYVPDQVTLSHVSLNQFMDEKIAEFSDATAYEHFGHRMSYRTFGQQVTALAAYLQQSLGVEPGDRIAIILPNCFAALVSLFAVLKVGAVVVNLNPLYTRDELTAMLKDAGVKVTIGVSFLIPTLSNISREVDLGSIIVAGIGDGFPWHKKVLINVAVWWRYRNPIFRPKCFKAFAQVLSLGSTVKLQTVDIQPEDLAFLQYTGGTTGTPKAAMLTHRNVLMNIQQTLAWFEGKIALGKEINLLALPLYHIFSLTVNCFLFFAVGGKNIIVTNPRDLTGLIKQIRHVSLTYFVGIGTLYHKLLQHPQISLVDFQSLKFCIAGGMAVQAGTVAAWQQLTGKQIVQGYGLTETSPILTVNPLNDVEFTGAVGFPLPSTDIQIVDEAGSVLALEIVGEVCVRGPQVMQGYWHEKALTEQVLTQEGWFRTGDLGYLDKTGLLYLVERKKDMVIVSGFNVYPSEVEAIFLQHQAIDEIAIIGVADEMTGEALKAFVVPKSADLTVAALKVFANQALTRYKQPKHYVFCDSLPKSPVGKVLKKVLVDYE